MHEILGTGYREYYTEPQRRQVGAGGMQKAAGEDDKTGCVGGWQVLKPGTPVTALILSQGHQDVKAPGGCSVEEDRFRICVGVRSVLVVGLVHHLHLLCVLFGDGS